VHEYLASPEPLIWPKIVAMQFGLLALSLVAFLLERTLSELWPLSEQGPWSPMHALLPVSMTIMLLGVFCAVLLLPVQVAVTADASRLPVEWHTVGLLLLAACAPSLLTVLCVEMDLYGVPARIADPISLLALLLLVVCFLYVAEVTLGPMALVSCLLIPGIVSGFYVAGNASDDPRVRYRRELEERDGRSVIDAETPASSTYQSNRLPAASAPPVSSPSRQGFGHSVTHSTRAIASNTGPAPPPPSKYQRSHRHVPRTRTCDSLWTDQSLHLEEPHQRRRSLFGLGRTPVQKRGSVEGVDSLRAG
jgi:hypothetical protein